jgi:alkylation response protein AidB-like acyl-CoA dehydrogenase
MPPHRWGIAEAAYTAGLECLASRNGRAVSATGQMQGAENAISLSAMRATFGRAAELVDAFDRAQLASDPAPEEWRTIFAEVQAAKTFVGETAARIVDRGLTLAGGVGYVRSHQLSRAYRDVRVCGFMQPLGSVRAHEYLAHSALGLVPALS